MKSLKWGLVSAFLVVSGCAQVQEWEGPFNKCSDQRADGKVLLILTEPLTPNPTGWFGTSDVDARDTWTITEIQDAQLLGNQLTFTARLDQEFDETWKVDLVNTGPNEYRGQADVELTVPQFVSSRTSQCTLVLKLQQ